MDNFETVLMRRDGMRKDEALRRKREARAELYRILEEGGDYDDVEEMMADEYGLELDYIEDLL